MCLAKEDFDREALGHLVSNEKLSGADLRMVVSDSLRVDLTLGLFYSSMAALVSKGYVTQLMMPLPKGAAKVVEARNNEMRYFQITEEGRKARQELTAQPSNRALNRAV